MSTEGSETEPLTLTEIAVYLGLIKNSQTNLPRKRVRKTSSKTSPVQSQIEFPLKDYDLTLTENEEDRTNLSDQQSHTQSVASTKYDRDEAEEKLTTQEIELPSLTKEKIRLKIDYDLHEILDLCINKLQEVNNRLRYLDELKIDENYEPDLINEISDQRNTLLAEYKKLNELIPILKREVKNELIKNVEDLSKNQKPENLEKNYQPLPETKFTDMDWFVKSILQLTRALNQRYPSEDNSIQIPKDENWFVETILQLIKLDERARTRTFTPEQTKTSSEEKPKQDTTPATIKNSEDAINNRINSRVSSLMREIQEIENKYTKAIQKEQILARPYTQPSVVMSTESEKINERIKNLDSKLNNLNVRKAQLASELTNITASIDTLRPKTTTKDFKDYPTRGVLTIGILAVILGFLILFPVQPPFLLQYIFGVGFSLIGGGIIIDSIWAHLERRGHR